MAIPTFTEGYPPDGSSLGETKAVIRDNLDGTFKVFSQDHRDQNESNPGYHTVIREQTQTTVSTVSGINQIFSGVPGTLIVNGVTTPFIPKNGDVQLYSLTGAGGLSQLTGNVASGEGFCWVGGILIQWGSVAPTSSPSGTVTFSSRANCSSFPNNCFNVYTSLKGSLASIIISVVSSNTSGFNWAKAPTNTAGFAWFAIGN